MGILSKFAIGLASALAVLASAVPVPAAAQDPLRSIDRPVDKMSVEAPRWERAGALLVVDVTVNNGNEYPVKSVIIACDLVDDSGAHMGSRGTAIRTMFQPGSTRITGLQLLLRSRNAQVAGCRVVSAKRAMTERTPAY